MLTLSENRLHIFKIELTHQQPFRSHEKTKQVVFKYIEVFYNRERLHSVNRYISSIDF